MDIRLQNDPLLKDYYYTIKIKELDLVDPDFVRERGMYITGNERNDRNFHRRMIETQLPLNAIIDKFKNYSDINVCKANELELMYDNLSKCLEKWKNNIFYGMNINNIPEEDLFAMDSLADRVYDYIKHNKSREEFSLWASQYDDGKKVTKPGDFMSSNTFTSDIELGHDRVNITRINSSDEPPKRVSFKDILSERFNSIKRYK